MELVPNSFCSLCDENTSVLGKNAVGPFITEAGKVFFNADENAFKQDELLKGSICSLCVQKISACTKFKNAYEGIIKRSGPKKARSCYICEKKKLDCIKTMDDPNDIIAKFTLLTKYSSNTILYKDCEMCLHCLFDIHLWYELHNILIKRLNIDGQALKCFQCPNRSTNFSSGNGIVKKDKENVTPPHNNIISNERLQTTCISTGSKSSSSKKLFKQSRRSKLKLNRSSRDLSTFLSDKLKNFKCLQDGLFHELNCPDSILSDYKMLNEIPYVLVSQMEIEENSKTEERKSSRLCKPIEIIDIDSEDEPDERTTRVSFQLPPKGTSADSEEENKDENELKFSCNICDRVFLTRSSYKLHSLWHEKPEHCQVNLVRYELPSRVKFSEFAVSRLTKSTTNESPNLDDIISKYVNISVTEDTEKMSETEDTSEAMDLSNKDEARCIGSNNISKPENTYNIVDTIESIIEDKTSEQEITTNLVENLSQNDDKLESEEENESSILNVNTCVALEEEHSLTNEKIGIEDVEVEEVVENGKSISENNNSTENIENSSQNFANDIEKALAQIHEEDETDEDDGDDIEEDSDEVCETPDKIDPVSDDNEDRNHLKRKRIDSNVSSDDQNSSDDNIPKLKKVRFAIDYSYAKLSGQTKKINKEENLANKEVPTSLPIYVDQD
ncbi:hypothetical protein FQR65_LT13505 [Abscondita terminalis]|nr:hypothetical protein FQR65_LT13505 [Abscondita terminalis]